MPHEILDGFDYGKVLRVSSHTGDDLGRIHYSPPRWMLPAKIHDISTYPNPGQGNARFLIQELVEVIGHVPIVAEEIQHVESWTAMRELGLLSQAYSASSWLNISDRSNLDSIPICRKLIRAGMNVEYMSIRHKKRLYDSLEQIYQIMDEYRGSPQIAGRFFFTKIRGRI